jgi:hypothetical protein
MLPALAVEGTALKFDVSPTDRCIEEGGTQQAGPRPAKHCWQSSRPVSGTRLQLEYALAHVSDSLCTARLKGAKPGKWPFTDEIASEFIMARIQR